MEMEVPSLPKFIFVAHSPLSPPLTILVVPEEKKNKHKLRFTNYYLSSSSARRASQNLQYPLLFKVYLDSRIYPRSPLFNLIFYCR